VKSATANFKQINFPKPKEVLSHGSVDILSLNYKPTHWLTEGVLLNYEFMNENQNCTTTERSTSIHTQQHCGVE